MQKMSRRTLIANMLAAGGAVTLYRAAPLSLHDAMSWRAGRGDIDALIAWVKIGTDNLATILSVDPALPQAERSIGYVARWNLIQTIARQWQVAPQSITLADGRLLHVPSGRSTRTRPSRRPPASAEAAASPGAATTDAARAPYR